MTKHRRDRRSSPAPTKTAPPLGFLGRGGRFVSRHHRWFAIVWVLLIVLAGYLNGLYGKSLSDSFRINGTDSQAAYDLMADRFQGQEGATATVVYQVPDGQSLTDAANAKVVADVTDALSKADGVASVPNPISSDPKEALAQYAANLDADQAAAVNALAPDLPPSLSSDGRTAYATVTFTDTLVDLMEAQPINPDEEATAYDNPYNTLQKAVDSVDTGPVTVAIGGPVADSWNAPVSWWANHADEVGLALGAILLLVAFGSLFGMAIPIATALFGAVVASGFVYLLASIISVSSAAPPVTLMISIGVGLDYSLLIVTRYRSFLAEGYEPHDAVGMAMASAGKAAVFAGLTVCIALLGLLLVPIPLVQTLGVAAAIGVAVMILAATTLLPTLLGFAGNKIDRVRLPFNKEDPDADPEKSFWGRFAHTMSNRPWFSLLGGLAVLVVLAFPFLSIDFGMPDDSSQPSDLSQRTAFVEIDSAFGPGTNGPLVVAVALPTDDPGNFESALTTLDPVSKAVAALQPPNTVEGIQYSVGPIPNDVNATTAVIYSLTPTTGPDDQATTELVERLRSDLATATSGTQLEAHVGGNTATLIDLTKLVVQYLPYVIAAVVLGSFILLTLVFRSILVPLKAAFMNLISISAAYGVVVAVFQWGWARQVVGLSETIPIVSFVPLVMFVILFGLSMDYEVFLMSRIREEWDRTHEPRTSVVLGVANTARVITTAALIMIAVFASFITNANPTVKLIGFGMAVAVLIDSTIVRMVLVPAIMELLGKRAWWFPTWLEWLPKLDVEGPSSPAPAATPATPAAGPTPPSATGADAER
ncbi:MMPL family transporter [Rhabdothermincola salaria]|uniref:MMPL family transporter n=1 Tax=Rhabdothermincola salaria TaxID=2903142 RepID=UPI001E600356|nr:MMPL family transporter [Rhabdothermincola salaria]